MTNLEDKERIEQRELFFQIHEFITNASLSDLQWLKRILEQFYPAEDLPWEKGK